MSVFELFSADIFQMFIFVLFSLYSAVFCNLYRKAVIASGHLVQQVKCGVTERAENWLNQCKEKRQEEAEENRRKEKRRKRSSA